MANLNEIVDFCVVAHACVAPAAAIDAAASSDLNLVANQHMTQLRFLLDAAISLDCEAEAVSADAHAAMQYTVRADRAVLYGRVHAHNSALTDPRAWPHDAPSTQLTVAIDVRMGEDNSAWCELRRLMDIRRCIHVRARSEAYAQRSLGGEKEASTHRRAYW